MKFRFEWTEKLLDTLQVHVMRESEQKPRMTLDDLAVLFLLRISYAISVLASKIQIAAWTMEARFVKVCGGRRGLIRMTLIFAGMALISNVSKIWLLW